MQSESPVRPKYKKYIPVVLAVLLLGAIVVGIFLRPGASGNAPAHAGKDSPVVEGPLKIDLSQAKVTISFRTVLPVTVKIKTGESVAWINKDRAQHLIVSDTGYPGFKGQGALGYNDMYLFTFNTAGTYSYHDQFNPSLKGTIIVE